MPISIHPLVFPAWKKISFEISGLAPGNAYRVVLLPVREKNSVISQSGLADEAGRLAWDQEVAWQGEALVDIFVKDGSAPLDTRHVFATTEEIASRRPVRCDFHIHTTRSDGKNSVAEMVLRGREYGLDALAITDHNVYATSIEAKEIAARPGMGLVCLPGEEVTSSTWHLLSIGASEGIGYPEREGYSGLRWAIDQVHRSGGKAYLAHPYWFWNRRYNQPVLEYEQVLRDGGLDGIELLGDVSWEENLLSVARFFELGTPDRLPILGNSDAHDAIQTYGLYWTLVFARSLTAESILEAVQERTSVACSRMLMAPGFHPAKPRLVPFGPYELVDLAFFLDAHYFAAHDELCKQEAGIARRIFCGEPLPSGAVDAIRDEIEAHYRENWRS